MKVSFHPQNRNRTDTDPRHLPDRSAPLCPLPLPLSLCVGNIYEGKGARGSLLERYCLLHDQQLLQNDGNFTVRLRESENENLRWGLAMLKGEVRRGLILLVTPSSCPWRSRREPQGFLHGL